MSPQKFMNSSDGVPMHQAFAKSAFLSLILVSAAAVQAGEVQSFFPVGSVKKVQQATARFTTDMVALGDPRAKENPFDVTCKGNDEEQKKNVPKYSTRWVDSKNWSLDFDKALPAGIRCQFKLKSGLQDHAGNKVTGAAEYSFSTSGPALLGVAPQYGNIEPDQYFVLLADGPFDAKSVEAKAFFEVEGYPDKVKAKIVTGPDRDNAIEAAVRDQWQWDSYRRLLPKVKKPVSQIKGFENFFVLSASRRFPEKAKVVLHWPKGILSKSGIGVEEPQEYDFQVIEPFSAKFECERTNANRGCNPILDMRVSFTRPIPLSSLKGTKLVSEKNQTWLPQELTDKKKNKDPNPEVSNLTFRAPFPDQTKFKIHLPAGLKDGLGRALQNQAKFPLAVETDESSPLVKFAGAFGVLERKADPVLPLSLRNVEKNIPAAQLSYEGKSLRLSGLDQAKEVIRWYREVERKENDYFHRNESLLKGKKGQDFRLPKPSGEKEFELIGIPLKAPGFHVVELSSQKLGQALLGEGTMYVAAAALVTDLSVHLKKGRESSLVWVTQLSNAQPVASAQVVIMTEKGRELARGMTAADGTFRTGVLNYPCARAGDEEGGEENDSCAVYAFAQKGDEFSFVSSQWEKGIESYRFNVSREYLDRQWGPVVSHTILDRMVAKTGDTIHMKHLLREHRGNGFGMMNPKKLPKRVFVVHNGTHKVYTLPFDYDSKTGTAVGEFAIPKDASLGRYSVYVSNKDKMPKEADDTDPFDWTAQETGHFMVADYRLPLMKATVKVQGEPLIRPAKIDVDLSASYLSGGPAKGMKVKVRSSLAPGFFTPDLPGANEYRFFSKPMKPGIQPNEERVSSDESFLKTSELTLNADGGAVATVKDLPPITRNLDLTVEMEYMDPNGEVKTATATTPVFPAQVIVGLKSESWFSEAGKAKVAGVLTDPKGKVLPNRSYVVDAYKTEYVTHRKRLVGGFYSYDSKSIVTALGQVCQGKSDDLGRFTCVPQKLGAGEFTLQARAMDDKGRMTYAATEISVFEAGAESWWVPSDSDRIDLIPEKTKYEPGTKAKFVVRTPYPEATVLMTVEREGLLDAFVTQVKRDNPVVEVPIKGNYAPNIFVSALLVRGRVADPRPTALVDLARPVMKMGMADLKVNWKAHELLVEVKPNKKTYHPREKMTATVKVKAANGAALPAGTEVAVAVVDEALLRLKENTSWKILDAMMGERSLAVTTSSMQNQVIGKRHFGSKAKPPGGGGGAEANPRELFEPVLYWEPRLKLNSKGEGQFEVAMNDSMTSFRVVAVALAGEGLFGDGRANVESTKDLMLLSGFAPVVRDGDQIKNVFTIRNTTAKPMKVSVTATSNEWKELPKLPDVELKANSAQTLQLPLTVPAGLKQFSVTLSAKDQISNATDAAVAKIKVEESVPDRVIQATLFQLDQKNEIPVQRPKDSLPGRGGINLSAKATLVSGLAGVRSYMEDYPYSCLEQRTSKAIATENKDEMKKIISELPAYTDGNGLLKFFPSSLCGSMQLTRYVLAISQENEVELPPATQETLIKGLQAYLQGRHCDSWWDQFADRNYSNEEKVLAMEALSRFKALKAADLEAVKATPNLWKTETVLAWNSILQRLGDVPNRDAQLAQMENILRSRVNYQGTSMNLQDELDWMAEWRLFTSRDQEAMGILSLAIKDPKWQEDAGKVARAIVARQKLGRWETTMANAWGVTVMRQFSAKFEKEKISGDLKAQVGDSKQELSWGKNPNGGNLDFAWPKGSETKSTPFSVTQAGSGKPWVTLQARAAIPLTAPWDVGYKVARKVTPVVQKTAGSWSIGDVANVELTVTAKADQSWVVIEDPIPAGASHLGTGLEGGSRILDRDPQHKNSSAVEAWPTEFEEKPFAKFISYAAYLPRGTYRLNYRVRLNSAGEFKLPPTHIEAMYSPETFGEAPNAVWKVEP